MDIYAPGLVVVPRTIKGEPARGGRRTRTREGWTRHREDCRHAGRATVKLQAPLEAYPDTLDCPECQPGNPHRVTVIDTDGGSLASCEACDIVGVGGSYRAASLSSRRQHDQAASRVALEAARAALTEGQPLLVIAPRYFDRQNTGQKGWTLHVESCAFTRRAKELWPAPAEPRPGTVECEYCRPLSGHSVTWTDAGGGKSRGRCGCGHDTGEAPSQAAARNRLSRMHAALPDGPK